MKCSNCVEYHLEWCSKKHDSPDPDMERECRYFKRATNADRIRAMTDEELASEFAKIEGDPYNGATIGLWLDWLKQEGER